jgi:hypothetical protein
MAMPEKSMRKTSFNLIKLFFRLHFGVCSFGAWLVNSFDLRQKWKSIPEKTWLKGIEQIGTSLAMQLSTDRTKN